MGRSETGRTGARFGAPARRAQHTEDPDTAHGRPIGKSEVDEAAPVPDVDALDDGADDGADVGQTGARFGGRGRTTRRERQADKARARDERAAQDAIATPDPGPAADPAPEDDVRPTVELPRVVDERSVAIAARPYVLTGGRTKVRAELRIETLVSATGGSGGESGERHTVLVLCARPRSVSEVAALTGVPLGVARVLIDDLATEGRLRVHLDVDPTGGPDIALLDRVLSGLRRL